MPLLAIRETGPSFKPGDFVLHVAIENMGEGVEIMPWSPEPGVYTFETRAYPTTEDSTPEVRLHFDSSRPEILSKGQIEQLRDSDKGIAEILERVENGNLPGTMQAITFMGRYVGRG
ncbi:hypothetical protein J4212_08335 [Candidatus Woesearchaeota archaeon]|nr:hypothetical protein [Candidatus Woesearchaeota archaeon]